MAVTKVWYRSRSENGALWCESSSPEEVIKMSAGRNVSFEKIVYFEVTNGWEEWDADAHPTGWRVLLP